MVRYPLVPIVMIVLIATGCASGPKEESALRRNDAIDDYIKVSELEELELIRERGELHHEVLTHKYIILRDRRSVYLATFTRQCRELDDADIRPDIRHDANVLRSRFDTYRGCKIQSLFALTDGQAKELIALGEKARE